MVSKFLDPKNDVAFRKIFGTEKNKDLLIHFLNDMIDFKGKKLIQEVTFLKTIQDPETIAKKTSIVDILCKDEKGNQYIVEMQVAKEKGFVKRAQYYASKAYISQMNTKGSYHNLKEVIFLAISDFIMFPEKKDYKSDHMILDVETLENNLRDFSFTFLELPKFDKTLNELSNIVEKWMYFFKHTEETTEKDLERIVGNDQIIERAYEELNRFSWSDEELLSYDQEEKYEGCYIASMEQKFDEGMEIGEKRGLEKGKEEGLQEGEKRGLEKGLEKGKEEGLQEGEKKAKIALAVNLLKEQFPIEKVSELTELSEEELDQLKIALPKDS